MTPPAGADLTISYRRSGGLAGVDLAAAVDARDLADEHAATAHRLLADPPAAHRATSPSRRSDQFDHWLTVTQGASKRSFHWSDGEVPDSARALVSALAERAEPTR